jgi:hypothetical protein
MDALRLASLLAIEAPARLVATRLGASDAAGADLGSFFDAIIERTEPALMASIPSE